MSAQPVVIDFRKPVAKLIASARKCFICGAPGLCRHREPAVLRAETEAMERWQRQREGDARA